jgi:hypothetical protein
MPYILEVKKFKSSSLFPAKLKHVGYINKIFQSKQEAANYYDFHNPHMRNLNAHKTWRSDWDPDTKLMYIVRKYFGEELTLPLLT